MLSIRRKQLDALRQTARTAFAAEVLEHFGKHFPAERRVLGDAQLRRVVDLGMCKASEHGFRLTGQVSGYVTLMGFLGSHFDRDPQLPWAAKELAVEQRGSDRRMISLQTHALAHINQIAGADGGSYRQALVRARRLPFTALISPPVEILARLHPAKHGAIDPTARACFLALAREKAVRAGIFIPEGEALTAALMFLLGSHYDEDPLHPWAAEVLAASLEPREKALCLYERACEMHDRYFDRDAVKRD